MFISFVASHSHKFLLSLSLTEWFWFALYQAAAQGRVADPNITKYSVKVLPVSSHVCEASVGKVIINMCFCPLNFMCNIIS